MSKTINFNKLIVILLPPYKRVINNIELLKALIKPIKTLYSSFASYRSDQLYGISFNSQIIYLEKYLNDKYNPGKIFSQIFIQDADKLNKAYIYKLTEDHQEVYIYNSDSKDIEETYIYNKAETSNEYDFTIVFPDGITYVESEVRAYINRLKIAGKRFNIITT